MRGVITLRKMFSASVLFAMCASAFLAVLPAQAATYKAQTTVAGGTSITMAPGERKEVRVDFVNKSDFTWKNDGPGYISLYTYGPKYRRSAFDPGTWLMWDQVKRIREASVAPGGTGSMIFELHAPQKAGTYAETFRLASEDAAWFDGGEFTLNITVKEGAAPAQEAPAATSASAYKGEVTMKYPNRVSARAGGVILVTTTVKNTGSKAWANPSFALPELAIATQDVSFAHPSWKGNILASASETVAPGGSVSMTFAIVAPQTNGQYVARFQLKTGSDWVDGAMIEIPVDVTGGSAAAIDAPVNDNYVEDTSSYITEPIVRIAFLIVDEETDNEVVITSEESDFTLTDLNGAVLAEMARNQTVKAYYQNGVYYYNAGSGLKQNASGLRFVPKTANAVMKVANFDRRVTRGFTHADNEHRGVLELRYNSYKDRTWVINELPIEYYLRGLAETSNISPLEFQKTLITTARTYAYYHYTHGTKYAKEFFHITSYSWDQVYNGYGQEKRAPNITKAVEETRGTVVTYDGNLAITPYFSRSDGRTRDWSEVWAGSVAWAKSVPVPCDAGKTLWGHGVGMSASGALCMARDGQTWDQILKYFYTGIDLDKRWQ